MSNELALITGENFSREKIDLIKRTIAVGATDDELQLFLYTCQRTGLDPLAKQIYAVKRSGKMAIQTGIDGYRLIADRTGKLAGISDYIFDSEDGKMPGKATVTVKKLLDGGTIADFTATARWGEYQAGGPMWAKMPYLMLGKCAEALALRKAFPADLSGVYTTEEMAQADNAQQGEAVFAEVERQKSAHRAVSYPTVDASEAVTEIPPELEWSYNKGSGVLICRVLDAKVKTKKDGKSDFVAIKLNGKVEDKDVIFYFHTTYRDALLRAVGKVVKMTIKVDGKFVNVAEVLEVAGEKIEASKSSPETAARLLASTLEFTEDDLSQLLSKFCDGSWLVALEKLQAEKVRRETATTIDE